MNSYRIPKLGSELELWLVQQMITGWFVRQILLGTVSAAQQEENHTVRLRMLTRDGYEYECARPIQPDITKLFKAPWKLISKVVPFEKKQHSGAVWIESVLAHNHYHAQGISNTTSMARDGLILPGSPPRVAVPRGDVERCHAPYYRYTGGLCPECPVISSLDEIRQQALS